jgi:hypothetical protein
MATRPPPQPSAQNCLRRPGDPVPVAKRPIAIAVLMRCRSLPPPGRGNSVRKDQRYSVLLRVGERTLMALARPGPMVATSTPARLRSHPTTLRHLTRLRSRA